MGEVAIPTIHGGGREARAARAYQQTQADKPGERQVASSARTATWLLYILEDTALLCIRPI